MMTNTPEELKATMDKARTHLRAIQPIITKLNALKEYYGELLLQQYMLYCRADEKLAQIDGRLKKLGKSKKSLSPEQGLKKLLGSMNREQRKAHIAELEALDAEIDEDEE